MKNSNRFITGLVAAAVTFSTLMFAVGPKRLASLRLHHCKEENRNEKPQATQEKADY